MRPWRTTAWPVERARSTQPAHRRGRRARRGGRRGRRARRGRGDGRPGDGPHAGDGADGPATTGHVDRRHPTPPSRHPRQRPATTIASDADGRHVCQRRRRPPLPTAPPTAGCRTDDDDIRRHRWLDHRAPERGHADASPARRRRRPASRPASTTTVPTAVRVRFERDDARTEIRVDLEGGRAGAERSSRTDPTARSARVVSSGMRATTSLHPRRRDDRHRSHHRRRRHRASVPMTPTCRAGCDQVGPSTTADNITVPRSVASTSLDVDDQPRDRHVDHGRRPPRRACRPPTPRHRWGPSRLPTS